MAQRAPLEAESQMGPLGLGMEGEPSPDIAAGKGLPAHWDPSDPRDLEMIRSAMKRYPKRFREMGEAAQAEVVAMVALSAEQARKAAKAAVTVGEITDAGRLAALSATVGAGLVKIQQADEHHADDLEVAKANAVANLTSAGLNKTYLGLDPSKV